MRHLFLLLAFISHVSIWSSAAYQVCPENRKHYCSIKEPHRHVALFAQAKGDIAPGDLLIMRFSDEEAVFTAEHGAVEVDYPAGIGTHDIVALWLDKEHHLKRSAHTNFDVLTREECGDHD